MATPNSRQTLKDFCLRQLGHPVLEINVDDDQLEDRIDDALQVFQDYHFDGTQKLLLKHKVTGSTMNLKASPAPGTFTDGETITGASSGATAVVSSTTDSTTLIIRTIKKSDGKLIEGETAGSFTAEEKITGGSSSAEAYVSSLTLGDVDNQWIPIDDSIIGVEQVFPFDHAQTDVNMFDIRYQIHLNDIYDMGINSLINYDFAQRRISQLEDIFNQAPRFRYNRHMDRLYLDIDWADQEAKVDKWLVIEAYKIIDPGSFSQIYNDIFLKKYTTSLFKKQWGSNLIKFEGMQLPGGVTLNGRQMYDDAQQELERIEEELQLKYQLPDDFMVG
tara:strand:+ start:567 stop:1562 length:996 start_codon:yes stop_codon:yes gene_type:complete